MYGTSSGQPRQNWAPEVLLSGEADISLSFVPSDITQIEVGAPVVVLAASHIGCVELVGGTGSDRLVT